MKYFDPMTFEEVKNPATHNICTSCKKKSLTLYHSNGFGRISPSCFSCMTTSASDEIYDR